MVAQQITLDRPELIRKLILSDCARGFDAGDGRGHNYSERRRRSSLSPTTHPRASGSRASFRFKEDQEAGRAYLKRYFSRTENRGRPATIKSRRADRSHR